MGNTKKDMTILVALCDCISYPDHMLIISKFGDKECKEYMFRVQPVYLDFFQRIVSCIKMIFNGIFCNEIILDESQVIEIVHNLNKVLPKKIKKEVK